MEGAAASAAAGVLGVLWWPQPDAPTRAANAASRARLPCVFMGFLRDLKGSEQPVAEIAEARQDVFAVIEFAVEGCRDDVELREAFGEACDPFGCGDDAEQHHLRRAGSVESVG